MTSQMVRRFQLPGQTREANIISSQDSLKRELISKMRDEGWIPLYDINPVWQWKWLKDDVYEFVLTMHGVYVGKVRAWEIDGITDGKEVPSSRKKL